MNDQYCHFGCEDSERKHFTAVVFNNDLGLTKNSVDPRVIPKMFWNVLGTKPKKNLKQYPSKPEILDWVLFLDT